MTDDTNLSEETKIEETVLTEEKNSEETPNEEEKTPDTDVTLLKTEETKEEEDSKADEPDGAPETYEDFTIPDGFEMNADLLNDAKPIFKEAGLSQEVAQKFIDLQSTYVQKEMDAQQEEWKKTMDTWSAEAKADKEYGGNAFNTSFATAKEAINAFGDDSFKQMLEITGVGNHPSMIRFLFNIGTLTKEHGIHIADKGETPVDMAAKMFPTMANKS